jgi:hypothetical protein
MEVSIHNNVLKSAHFNDYDRLIPLMRSRFLSTRFTIVVRSAIPPDPVAQKRPKNHLNRRTYTNNTISN